MTSTAQGLYGVLFPQKFTRGQEFWNKNFPIIKNDENGYAHYLSFLAMILGEQLFFFKKSPERNNAFPLILTCTIVWQLIRDFAEMSGDDLDAFRKKSNITSDEILQGAYGEDVLPFLKLMNKIHSIHSFIRHPQNKFEQYKWILSEKWPENEVLDLISAATDLRTVLVFLSQDCSKSAGWVGDRTKAQLHENAEKFVGETA